MSKKALLVIIFSLVLTNCVTIAFLVSAYTREAQKEKNDEIVAKIGNSHITRQEWLNELEKRFGKTTLEEMINIQVVDELAKKNHIDVDEKTVEREIQMYKISSQSYGDSVLNDKELRKQIRYSILLEELLTKDVNISENELKKFYEENKHQYIMNDTYHLSHIVVDSKKEVQQIINELKGGSSFEGIAAERSKDQLTAKEGGDLGYVSEGSSDVPPEYIEQAKTMKVNEWSDPIPLERGYAIIFLHEKIKGEQLEFDEVKDQIRRQIALEQMEGNVSAKQLWDDIGVTWFYEK